MGDLTAELIVNKAVTEYPRLPRDTVLAHLREILRWNPQLGLVSRREPLAACERLVLESLELLAFARAGLATATPFCADVGSGAGFPGIVWALAEPDWRFVLIERKAGRAAFLEATARRLSLGQVEVFAGPVEEAVQRERFAASFDLAVTMAVAAPVAIGPSIERLLHPAGRYYGTVSADAPPPAQAGKSLVLERNTIGEYGNYVVYRRVP
jgi:16S rRNA (guanine527-N7)-methyltransferase